MIAREWHRLKNRFVWSWAGLVDTWRSEASFKFWSAVNVVSAFLALLLPLGAAERALVLSLGVLILAAELLNTAIERTVDHISIEVHPLARRAKDAGSAGVAFAALAGGVAWAAILLG